MYIQSLFRAALPPSLAPDRYTGTRSLSQAVVMLLHIGGWRHKGRHPHEDTNKHNQPGYETRETTKGQAAAPGGPTTVRNRRSPKASPTGLALTIRQQCVATRVAPHEPRGGGGEQPGKETTQSGNGLLCCFGSILYQIVWLLSSTHTPLKHQAA